MPDAAAALAETRTIADINIVGFGISVLDHMTLAGDRAIRASNEVLYVDHGLGIKEFLSARCNRVTDLSTLYHEGSSRGLTYQQMASKVIEAAVDHPPVTFGLYGHPLVFASPPFLVSKAATSLGLSVKVIAGVSAFDQILVDLMFDPCEHGTQMLEASDLVIRRRPVLPDCTVLIWQVRGSRISPLFK